MKKRSATCLCSQKYILPAEIRKSYKIGGIFTLVGLLAFALFMLVVGIKQDTDKIPCFAVAGIFGILFAGYLMVWLRNCRLIDAVYSIDSSAAVNCVDKLGIRTSVDLRSATAMDYTHAFYIGKGHFDRDYTIYTENANTHSAVSDWEGVNIYKVLKSIWASGSVIVPKAN